MLSELYELVSAVECLTLPFFSFQAFPDSSGCFWELVSRSDQNVDNASINFLTATNLTEFIAPLVAQLRFPDIVYYLSTAVPSYRYRS